MAAKSLQRQLLRLISLMLLVISASIIFAVWISSESYIRAQIDNDLDVGFSVLDRLLSSREEQLLNSAEVLTADFGFKQAVASSDAPTIRSALINHGGRISADLMALVSMQGDVVAASTQALAANQPFPVPALLGVVISEGGVTDFLQLGNEFYQIIMLPVNTPLPVGIAVIGFRVNQDLANELKQITLLDVTFAAGYQPGDSPSISTLQNDQLADVLANTGNVADSLMGFVRRGHYITRQFNLASVGTLSVYLSSSLDDAYARFDALQADILLITLVGIAVSLIGAVLFSRTLSRPLKSLAQVAGRVASGEYHKNVNVKADVEEISDLMFAFNRMQSDLSEREARIVYQANHDPLTGLINRRFAVEKLDELLAQAATTEYLICVVNILGFRAMNDTFGHKVGDLTLKEVAARLEQVQGIALKARLVGNEFLLVREQTEHHDIVLMDILMLLQQPYEIGELDISLNFCMGVAQRPRDATAADALLHRAGIALDTARQQQQQITYYHRGQEETYLKRLTLSADLKSVLAANDGQLRMYYQPKVAGKDLAAGHFEALIRWIHPAEGFVPPDMFIPLAEQSGLINELTNWVITTVIQQLKSWRDEGFDAQVAVNLSAQDLQRPQLLARVNAQLKQYNVPAKAISFEITESEVMREPEKAVALLEQFRSLGFDLAIDDFGTGYSSLAQLKNMPVTELKIDRAFVMNLVKLKEDQIIVQSTLNLARSFNLSVVAEGVEDEATANLLREWGIDWLQGYYFSRPLPAADVVAWVNSFNGSKV